MDAEELIERYNNGERDFRNADLSGAFLSGVDLKWADLSGANLGGVDLKWADLIRAKLRGADLTGAKLIGAKLIGAKLIGANLAGAHLAGAHLTRADLTEADLSEADLSGANLRVADLRGSTLRGAELSSLTSEGDWAFEGTLWPTDPAKLEGTTIDGVPFLEFMATLEAIGPNPSPEVRAAWDAMRDAQRSQDGLGGGLNPEW